MPFTSDVPVHDQRRTRRSEDIARRLRAVMITPIRRRDMSTGALPSAHFPPMRRHPGSERRRDFDLSSI